MEVDHSDTAAALSSPRQQQTNLGREAQPTRQANDCAQVMEDDVLTPRVELLDLDPRIGYELYENGLQMAGFIRDPR